MTKFERVMAGMFLAARTGNGGGLVLLLVMLPIAAVAYLAVFLLSGLVSLVGRKGSTVR